MEQANLPSQTDLNSLYGAWNPMSYMQGFQNQGLADQFRQQALESNQQANAQTALMNPLRVEELKQKNVGTGYDNTVKGLTAERAVANQPYTLSEDMRAHVQKMNENDFKDWDQTSERLLRSDNPDEQKRGLAMISRTPAMLAEKRKYDQAMALQKEQTRSHLEGIGMQTAANERINTANIEGGKYNRSKVATSVTDLLGKSRNPVQSAEILEGAYYQAMAAGDEAAAAIYQQRAQDARARAAEDARNRGLATPKVDTSALGVQNTPAPAAVAPVAGGAGKPSEAKTHTLSEVQQMYPGVPVDKVKQAYKAKYGVDLK